MSGETIELQEVVKRLDEIIELLKPCVIVTTEIKEPKNANAETKKKRGRKKVLR